MSTPTTTTADSGSLTIALELVLAAQDEVARLWATNAPDDVLLAAFHAEGDALRGLVAIIATTAGCRLEPPDVEQRGRTTQPLASVRDGTTVYHLVGCEGGDYGAVAMPGGVVVKPVVVELG